MPHEAAIKAALGVMTDHITALNAGDEARLAATLHFPHYRLSGAALKVWDNADRYLFDFRARVGAAWARSTFDDIRVMAASDAKVHLDTQVNRYDAKGNRIASFRSLWVITLENGVWAAKFRSSFAAT